ncbi:hypothetical protein Pint_30444 [Pistacia integerrima]|uniref:Uncharacterized protein n=1 Tax=Pistacia integerrima TaxID=434235 RepID=A0ACC0X1D6_9ROSI|nr:hypothetical protein Pint_30444 [Pistacia integerrima]
MEGLIPFIYRVIIQYRGSARQTTVADSWFSESPPMPYIRLPGDSGRFTLLPEYVFSSSPTSSSPVSSRSIASTGSPLPHRFSSSRPAYS